MGLTGRIVEADCNALKPIEDRARGLIKVRVFRPPDQNGSEHQAKETTLLQGEIKIGETDSAKAIALGRARHHRYRYGQLSKPLRGDLRKKIVLAREIPMCGRRGHSRTAGRLPHANGVWAGFLQNGPRRMAKGAREIAMTIGPSGHIHQTSHIHTPCRQSSEGLRCLHWVGEVSYRQERGHFPSGKRPICDARKTSAQ
jgi:hypothetical protein